MSPDEFAQLQARVSRLEARGGVALEPADSYSETYAKVGADGSLTFDFTGHVKAAGLDLDSATGGLTTDREIRWLRTTDGAEVALIGGFNLADPKGQLSFLVRDPDNNSYSASMDLKAHAAADNRSRVRVGANDPLSGFVKTLLDSGGGSDYPYTEDDRLLTVAAANIDFQSIPAAGKHILIVASLAGDAAQAGINTLIRFNNDAALNYFYEIGTFNGAIAPASAQGNNQATGFIGDAPAANIPNNPSAAIIFIPHYSTTANVRGKAWVGVAYDNEGVNNLRLFGGDWNVVSTAINRVTLLPSAGNFAAGSRATLYVL